MITTLSPEYPESIINSFGDHHSSLLGFSKVPMKFWRVNELTKDQKRENPILAEALHDFDVQKVYCVVNAKDSLINPISRDQARDSYIEIHYSEEYAAAVKIIDEGVAIIGLPVGVGVYKDGANTIADYVSPYNLAVKARDAIIARCEALADHEIAVEPNSLAECLRYYYSIVVEAACCTNIINDDTAVVTAYKAHHDERYHNAHRIHEQARSCAKEAIEAFKAATTTGK